MTMISKMQKKITANNATRSRVLFSGELIKICETEKPDNPKDVNKINEVIILLSKFMFS